MGFWKASDDFNRNIFSFKEDNVIILFIDKLFGGNSYEIRKKMDENYLFSIVPCVYCRIHAD